MLILLQKTASDLAKHRQATWRDLCRGANLGSYAVNMAEKVLLSDDRMDEYADSHKAPKIRAVTST